MGAANYDPRCSDLESTSRTSDTLDRAGVGLLIGAGAAAVASVLYFVWPASKSTAPTTGAIRVVPAVSAGGGRVLFSGTF
jgi:hypothetical protein